MIRNFAQTISLAAFAFTLGAACNAALAGSVQTWHQETLADFKKGKLKRAVISSEGKVGLSRQLKSLADLKATNIWALANDKAGNVIAATGGPGSIVKIDANGQTSVVYTNDKEQIFSLAISGDGEIYAGVSPSGKIVRVKAGGGIETFYSTGETYVWSLAVDEHGDVFAATGAQGKLFRIRPTGEGKLLYQAKQPHLLSLALAPEGIAYAGSSKDGLIYRVAPSGKAYVVYDASQADIHTLLRAADGTLYAGTGSPARTDIREAQRTSTSEDVTAPSNDPSTEGIDASADGKAKKTAVGEAAEKTATKKSSSSSTTGSAAARSTATPGQNSVYRVKVDGTVDEILREEALILSLAVQDDRLLVGTGQEGRLFQVNPETLEHGELARLENGQINSLVRRPDGSIVIGAGTPGNLYLLEDRYADAGTFTSEVLDAKMQARWGRAIGATQVPDGKAADATVKLTVRTGNVSDPDATWSDWTDDATKLPLGRFFQYQAAFASPNGKASPSLSQFTLYYATVNRPPAVESIETPNLKKTPVLDAAAKVTIKWKASDPNSDKLVYVVSVQKDGWPDWLELAKDLDKDEYAWDPGSMPGGSYRVRVVASDRNSNREEDALTASRSSEAFIIDRDPPTVRVAGSERTGKRWKVEVTANDALTRITSGAYSLDGKTWISIFPVDGIFDAPGETAKFQTDELASGTHVLMVRFADSAGHTGVADAILAVP